MKEVIQFIDKSDEGSVQNLFNMDFFTSGKASIPVDLDNSIETAKKRGRKKKDSSDDKKGTVSKAGVFVGATEDGNSDKKLSATASNEPYLETYIETNTMLRNSIVQIDSLQNDIKTELDFIKNSKTLKKKYDYISEMVGTASSLVGTKITAIREMNKVITDSHNLEMKRIKELKINEDAVDDNQKIMDMYSAFVTTPVGAYSGPNTFSAMPSIMEMTSGVTSDGRPLASIGIGAEDPYNKFVTNVTPTQNMMLLESNPNVQTVVMYDQATSNKWFDVINLQTGESVPNTEKPDQVFLQNLTIDLRNGIARDPKLDRAYKVVTINNSNLSQY